MSYAIAAALQAAVFQKLTGDVTLTGLVGTDIYDALPPGTVPVLYVSLGPEDVKDRSDQTGPGAEHFFTVSVISDAAGFQTAKQVAAAISDALHNATLTLSRGYLTGLWFYQAAARRVGNGSTRRIDLKFRARVGE
ncbi:MAG: DUF3168 domain-containing protein [Deltaproteobacteria bacterium]